MQIEWVNHASFIFKYDNVSLITDPWFEGTAFDNGWALLAAQNFSVEKFAGITHIWFSHEHPDHFSPPNLNKIPQAYRKNITVLFQSTTDRKVAAYCSKAGFKAVIELPTSQYVALSDKVSVKCNPFTDGDSWLYIKTDSYSLLNINDCVINDEAGALKIKSEIEQVDVLFTQFGYANKVGNTSDTALRTLASKEKLNRIAIQDKVFQPRWIVPFASYVYFCHQENHYMNDGMNRVSTIHDFIEHQLHKESVVLYPADQWNIGDTYNSNTAIAQYSKDYQDLDTGKRQLIALSNAVSVEELVVSSKVFVNQLSSNFKWSRYLPKVYFWLTDLNECYQLSINKGLEKSNRTRSQSDIALSSSALLYTFKFLWGGDTLQVNARFQIEGNYRKVRNFYNLSAAINRGEKITTKSFFKSLLISLVPQQMIALVRKPLSS